MFLHLSVILCTGQKSPFGHTPLPWAHTFLGTCLPGETPPRQTPLEMATAVEATHPTGMHYCFQIVLKKYIKFR